MIMSRSCAQPARTRVFSIGADARPSAVNNNYDGRFVLHRPPLSFSHVTLSRRYRVFRGRFAASARPPLTKLQRRANGSRGVQSTLSLSPSLPFSLFLSFSRVPVRVFNSLGGFRFPPSRDQYSGNPPKMRPSSCSPALSLFSAAVSLRRAESHVYTDISRFIRTSSPSHPFAFPDILVSAAKREVFRVSGFARSFAWALFLPTVAVGQNKGNTHSLFLPRFYGCLYD